MENIIEVKHLKKYYKEVKAVDDISFQVERGELFGFLGINGAGKSTTINMLCTIFSQTEGSAKICGYEIGKEKEQIRKRIGVVYQNNCLDDRLSVKENLLIRGSLYEKDSKKIKQNLEFVCECLELRDIIKRHFGKLSGGQKRKCEIARALMNHPEVLFLDEPTTGLDPATRKSVWRSIQNLRKQENMTVFLTTHYMEEAAKASHIAVLDEGKLKEFDTPFALKEKFAKDKLSIISKEPEKVKNILRNNQTAWTEKEEKLIVPIRNTMEAFPLLEKLKELISGFEVIQGSMDDVFLTVTGKDLEKV